jgi:hypothetical protein
MRVFIRHSHQQRALTEQMAHRLAAEAHQTFLDGMISAKQKALTAWQSGPATSLPSWFHPLRSLPAVTRSPSGLARQRWPNPTGRVLPVLVEPIDQDLIPPYLRAVHILKPSGTVVATQPALPARPSRGELRRVFPGTLVCTPSVERSRPSSDELWLVCRCPDGTALQTPNSLRIRLEGWRRSGWAFAAGVASDVGWRCP